MYCIIFIGDYMKYIKITKKICKSVVLSLLLLYSINIMLNAVNIFIPLNIFSISYVGFLGIPGLLSLIIMSLII